MRTKIYNLGKKFLLPLLLTLTVCFIAYNSDKMTNGKLRSFSESLKKTILSHKTVIPSVVVFHSKSEQKIENCQHVYHRSNISALHENSWQRLDSNSNVYVYSAYADDRLKDNVAVRILAVFKKEQTPKLFCKIWLNDKESSAMEADVKEMWIPSWDYEGKNGRYYQPILISCSASSNLSPTAVSLISEPCGEPHNILKISLGDVNKTKQNFAVCLKPLSFTKDISHRLLEWLELQFILGADVVNIYAQKLHPKTWEVVESYSKRGKVIIKNFTLPVDTYEALLKVNRTAESLWQKRRYEMVIYNDCFYNHIQSHKYVINLDLDEAIIPVVHSSWIKLLEKSSFQNPYLNRSASISVPNVYFFDSFGYASDNSIPNYMHMLRHVYRSANFTPPGFAQKSFFSTNYSLIVSNHYTIKAISSGIRLISAIDKQFAQLHHYRSSCPPLMEEDCKKNYMKYKIKDTVLWKFKNLLIENVKKRIRDLNLT